MPQPVKSKTARPTLASLLAMALALMQLHGCSALAPGHCEQPDWYAQGYQDGLAGRTGSEVPGSKAVCGESVEASRAAYVRGNEAGLRQYCAPANGFTLGSSGEPFHEVCPSALRSEFIAAYKTGQQLYVSVTQVQRLQRILEVNRTELHRLGGAIGRTRALLNGRDVPNEPALQEELRELLATRAWVEQEILAIESSLKREEYQLGLIRELTRNAPVTDNYL